MGFSVQMAWFVDNLSLVEGRDALEIDISSKINTMMILVQINPSRKSFSVSVHGLAFEAGFFSRPALGFFFFFFRPSMTSPRRAFRGGSSPALLNLL